MSVEENKDLVTRYVNEYNAAKGDATKILALQEKYYDPKFVSHLTTGDMNFEQGKQFAVALVKAFPDILLTIEDILAVGDKVVARHTWRGTHKGQWLGATPTGKKVSQVGISIWRIAGGKFVEWWVVMDTVGLMIQLGAIPNPYVQR